MRFPALAILLVAAAACSSDQVVRGALAPRLSDVPSGSVRADVAVTPLDGGVSRVVVHVRSGNLPLGAYQGSVTFDPAIIEVVSASTPAAADGHRVVNAQAAPGTVRFAGFNVTRLIDSTAFTMDVRSARPLAAGDLVTTLSVVGTPEGERLPQSRIAKGEMAIGGVR